MKEIKLYDVLKVMANAVIEAEPILTELDSKLGDGDCGIGMKTGFAAVLCELEGHEELPASELLKIVAMTLISSIGGTSGAIYGTAFMKMTAALKKESQPDLCKIGEILEVGLDGAKMRGEGTQVGDKTLVDALEPAVYAFKKTAEAGCDLAEACAAAAKAAKAGSDSTVGLIARKGRASYLGERSIGHRDAGSYGIYVIAKAIAEYVTE